jgi:hypothetical protein
MNERLKAAARWLVITSITGLVFALMAILLTAVLTG